MRSLAQSRLFRAVVERDVSFEGAFLFGVLTTGVFCRPGCGAKTPRRENVRFFDDAGAALRAGLRPCKRCRPLRALGEIPEWVQPLFDLVEHSNERVTSDQLRAAGIHPVRAARWFQEHFDMTFQAFQRARRITPSLGAIRDGADVSRTAFESGFDSESGFRAAFEQLFGAAPTRVAANVQPVFVQWIATPLGAMFVAARDEGICFLEFVDRRSLASQIKTLRTRVGSALVPAEHHHVKALRVELARYFAGELRVFETPVHAPGTPFQESVWAELRRIPYGSTRSYAELARAIGAPNSVRAVASANGRNRIALLIPCHRVIGSDGKLVGYAGSVWRKQRLLELEGARSDDLENPLGLR